MLLTITVEIDDFYITEHLQDHPNKTRAELIGEVGNILYLGCSSVDAMLERALEIQSTSWVESEEIK